MNAKGPLKHFIRYGIHGEQRYFAEFAAGYDGVVINGNILAHAPGALAKFVGETITTKNFIVDPQTHAFQHNPKQLKRKSDETNAAEDPGLKTSVAKMSKRFGEPIESRAGVEAVRPEDFEDPGVRLGFCQRVLDFQKLTLDQASVDGDYRQYLEYAKIEAMTPLAVIAPYFYMKAITLDKWIKTNYNLIEDSASLVSDAQLYAELVLDRDVLLRKSKLDLILELYGKSSCQGVCVWIDSLDEHEADEDLLDGFVYLVTGLTKCGKAVHNVYGGYFSALLTRLDGLDAFCHGLEYGESRPVVPVGGGIPMAKYYFPPLHRRLRYLDVLQILQKKGWNADAATFHANVCDCDTCREVLQGDIENFSKFGESKPVSFQRGGQTITLNYPLPETKDRCLRHYLRRKELELQELSSSSKGEIVARLRSIDGEYGRLLGDEIAFAEVWANLLEKL